MRTMLTMVSLALLVACGSSTRREADDGGTTRLDAGTARDAGRTDGAVRCGAELCEAGEMCCYDCDGTPSGCGPACPGYACPPDGGPEGACLSDSDCGSSEYCLPPGASRPCGIACMVERTCESSADCPEGNVCVEALGPCCSAGDPLSSQCIPECTAGSCGEGLTCGTDGLCAAISCTDGWTCPMHTTCTGTGDAHGCSRDTCTGSGECGEGGFCVDGRCYGTPGTCTLPSA